MTKKVDVGSLTLKIELGDKTAEILKGLIAAASVSVSPAKTEKAGKPAKKKEEDEDEAEETEDDEDGDSDADDSADDSDADDAEDDEEDEDGDDDDSSDGDDEDSEDDDADEEDEEKPSKGKTPTIQDVQAALKAYTKKKGGTEKARAKTVALLKKIGGVDSTSKLKPKLFAAVIAATK